MSLIYLFIEDNLNRTNKNETKIWEVKMMHLDHRRVTINQK